MYFCPSPCDADRCRRFIHYSCYGQLLRIRVSRKNVGPCVTRSFPSFGWMLRLLTILPTACKTRVRILVKSDHRAHVSVSDRTSFQMLLIEITPTGCFPCTGRIGKTSVSLLVLRDYHVKQRYGDDRHPPVTRSFLPHRPTSSASSRRPLAQAQKFLRI